LNTVAGMLASSSATSAARAVPPAPRTAAFFASGGISAAKPSTSVLSARKPRRVSTSVFTARASAAFGAMAAPMRAAKVSASSLYGAVMLNPRGAKRSPRANGSAMSRKSSVS
jgi:hypothetical protein